MTSSSPVEVPSFSGNTLTPECPVPVHVPEPQNIPVLMNQTDLAFNDMSTHMEQRYPPQNHTQPDPNGLQYQISGLFSQPIETKSSQPGEGSLGGVEQKPDGDSGLDNARAYNSEAIKTHQEFDIPDTETYAQVSVPISDLDSPSNHAKITSTSLSPTQNHFAPAVATEAVAIPSDESQTTPVSQGPDAAALPPPGESDVHSPASGSDVNGGGVNYQALLDNLSPSTSTAPASDTVTTITTITTAALPAPSSPSSAQTPIATLPIPAGLPPRPPPQEKPAIHPNYIPGEDIRSYHNPPAQNSNAPTAFNAQSSNPPRSAQGYNVSNGVAPNGLPPPPLATFQQPLSKSNQSQSSPQDPQSGQKEHLGQNTRRLSVSQEGDDEVPRRPDVEKLYEEFLRDEAVYVAEGTWDRFPQGSRLFIGTLSIQLTASWYTHPSIRQPIHRKGHQARHLLRIP